MFIRTKCNFHVSNFIVQHWILKWDKKPWKYSFIEHHFIMYHFFNPFMLNEKCIRNSIWYTTGKGWNKGKSAILYFDRRISRHWRFIIQVVISNSTSAVLRSRPATWRLYWISSIFYAVAWFLGDNWGFWHLLNIITNLVRWWIWGQRELIAQPSLMIINLDAAGGRWTWDKFL